MLLLAACGGRSAPEGGRWIAWAGFSGEPKIWIARADGSQRRVLVRDAFAPQVSPDGRWVAFEGCIKGTACLQGSGSLNLFVTAARGRGERRLLARGVFQASWAPGSDRLVGRREDALVSIAVDSGEVTLLRRGAFLGWSFAPAGGRLVYAHSSKPFRNICDDAIDLYTQRVAGGPVRRLTRHGRAASPVWGPGWIAFTRLERSCRSFNGELWLVRPDGRSAHRLARLPPPQPGYYGLVALDWRGGALLGGIATEWGDIALAVDPRTGARRRVAGDWYGDSLSHDGKKVLLFGGGAEAPYTIAWVPFRGGRARVIGHGDVGHESWNR